ncbi:hypothetical protein ACIPWF_04205 [Paenarthrobacter sp. NPDC089989]|uniref:hypothetical protein n=1 Tax=unclassified Paenarthrobacter TaxID=2634190 RepID=UPI00382AA147
MTTPELASACGNPCQECPFRKSNAGREHTSGNYDDQFIVDWRGISKGGFFACHVFAPDIHLHDEQTKAMGYVTPVETGKRPECAGATLAILRELTIAKTYPSHSAYLEARTTGLSRDAIQTIYARMRGEQGPPFIVPEGFDSDLIRDPQSDVDADSPFWAFGLGNVERMYNVMGEPASYEAMHKGASLRLADGNSTVVDVQIRPLLAAMSNTGIQTVSSCQDFREVIDAKFPDRLPFLLNPDPDEFSMNYRNAMETGGAYVRFTTTTQHGQAFLKAAADIESVTTQQAGDIAQLDFPMTALLQLTELASISTKGKRT